MIGRDKIKHFVVSLLGTLVIGIFLEWYLASAIMLLIGATKEIVYDKLMNKGCPEWMDMLFNLAGISVSSIILILI